MDIKPFYSFFLFFFIFISCQDKKEAVTNQFFYIQGEAQGSTYSIKYIAKEELVHKNEIDSLLTAFDLSLSTYRNDSKISKINAGDSTVIVDKLFVDTFKTSRDIYNETEGLFDPTIGVLINAYGFGPNKKHKSLSQKEIDSLLQYVGFDKVKLEPNYTVSKKYAQTYFDFNAIAQGYSVDVVANFLKKKGISNGIIEIGGELLSMGENSIDNKKWVVGIDDPLQKPDERKLIETIAIKDLGMATSGNYRKVIVDSVTGEKFVHIVNPKTGKNEKNAILSATVLAPTCIEADGYATAFMLMSIEQIEIILKEHKELKVMLLYVDKENKMQRFYSENFASLIFKKS
ncbi:FAD:protein FMN transferase [Flavobacterium sp. 9AF]|uniref:FAD:protein FMN transferase n=1 Tax=Flavobacterium sp. 9AF TaxID=2653142 RepID=UPI0012F329DB|nr:FAD:protein FMN transferase [Flavobacterium sp. 9AF]VXB12034.1 FAD:protein FMN transferase [Flavobacterium sp. 9AF]